MCSLHVRLSKIVYRRKNFEIPTILAHHAMSDPPHLQATKTKLQFIKKHSSLRNLRRGKMCQLYFNYQSIIFQRNLSPPYRIVTILERLHELTE